jgi:hypothetical protein
MNVRQYVEFFEIGFQTVCLGWPQTVILLTSASRVARITGMNHWAAVTLNRTCVLQVDTAIPRPPASL